jgi:hypothetical protein
MNYLLSVAVPNIVYVMIALGAIAFFVAAYFSGKSDSTQQVGTGSPGVHVKDGTGNTKNFGFLLCGSVLVVIFLFLLIFVERWEG